MHSAGLRKYSDRQESAKANLPLHAIQTHASHQDFNRSPDEPLPLYEWEFRVSDE